MVNFFDNSKRERPNMNNSRCLSVLFTAELLFAILFSYPGFIFSQQQGSIRGTVKDSSGAVLASAQVTVTNVGTNATKTGTTSEDGVYTFPNLPPGIYKVAFEAAGFKTDVRQDVQVLVATPTEVDAQLSVGEVTETITVEAQA